MFEKALLSCNCFVSFKQALVINIPELFGQEDIWKTILVAFEITRRRITYIHDSGLRDFVTTCLHVTSEIITLLAKQLFAVNLIGLPRILPRGILVQVEQLIAHLEL